MKWILCGKNDAGVACLEFLLDRGQEVWALGTAGDDGRDGWQRSFRAAAERRGIPFDQPARINDSGFVKRLTAYGASLLVSIQYDQILRKRLFQSIGCPCLNLHFALLPRHRGVSPIAWAILSGDGEAGVTLHHMVEEIDAGDVIARRAVPIAPGDVARDLYDKVSAAAVALFRECYPFPPELLRQRLPQDPSLSSYHHIGDFDFSKRHVQWSRPAAELHRWLRAMIFPPMQYPEILLGDRLLAVTRVTGSWGGPVSAPPGSVVAQAPDGIDVAALGGSVRISGIVDPKDPEAAADRVLESIAVGDRFH